MKRADEYTEALDTLRHVGSYAYSEINRSPTEKREITLRRKRRLPLGFQLPVNEEVPERG